MNSAERHALYHQRYNLFSEQVIDKKKLVNRVSNARLLVALLIIILGYYSFQYPVVGFLVTVLIVAFIFLVRWHSNLFEEQEHLENLVFINQNELNLLDGNYSAQPDGQEFQQVNHAYAHDLDIFGDGSLFQFINRACTAGGKEELAGRLLKPLSSEEEIINTQEAVRELRNRLDFRQHLQATAMSVKDTLHDREQLRAWANHPYLVYSNNVLRAVLVLLPVLTLSMISLAFFFAVIKPFAILLVLMHLGITGYYFKRVSLFHDYVSRKKNVLQQYSRILKLISTQTFESSLLEQLQQSLAEAERNVSNLSSRMSALDARLNMMTSLFANGLILYDLHCVLHLEKWKTQHAQHLEAWLNTISHFEVINSFAAYSFSHSSVYPVISDGMTIHAIDLAHPLLPDNERIANSITLGDPHKVFIITGANMAGKSTFLRTLGVNLVLALNGAPVCAREFSCPVLGLQTGMRANDSLKDHQSYFYAELQRLKIIMEELRRGEPLFVLLDEILKGTNSTDKLNGSVSLLKQLAQYNCLAVVATHDLALGSLEDELPGLVINYHFEPTIDNDQLAFDYRLKRGIAEKMNASFLMRKMGIIQ